ncbi:putative transcription factor C2H2 family [Dioscorea sansibarensis]
MAAASSPSPYFGLREEEFNNQMKQQQQQQQPDSSQPMTAPPPPPPLPPPKKKRNLPGNPNPDAEVIALSPKTLMATNRFVCEVCNKGFQREQNLQLHRRGHNLPWKLRQKSNKEVQRRKVYLCPEPTCVHHDPSRALGDLTGIKKHFSRKHGEKKWKCDKCSKRYAVQSDWKAHSKICGTREYRCDCGTLFSRRDSFITHRAFCDALAQESARLPPSLYGSSNMGLSLSQMNSSATDILRNTTGGAPSQFDHHQLITPSINPSAFRSPPPPPLFLGANQEYSQQIHGLMHHSELQSNTAANSSSSNNLFSFSFLSNTGNNNNNNNTSSTMNSSINVGGGGGPSSLFAGNLMSDHHPHHHQQQQQHLFNTSTTTMHNEPVLPQMSATALLQKAAQMGATSTSNASSLLRGFATSSSNSSGAKARTSFINENNHDQSHNENERHLQDLMNSLTNEGHAAMFGRYNSGRDTMTRDFLGVGSMVRGMAAAAAAAGGIDMGSISMDSDIKSASSSRSFAGGGLQ